MNFHANFTIRLSITPLRFSWSDEAKAESQWQVPPEPSASQAFPARTAAPDTETYLYVRVRAHELPDAPPGLPPHHIESSSPKHLHCTGALPHADAAHRRTPPPQYINDVPPPPREVGLVVPRQALRDGLFEAHLQRQEMAQDGGTFTTYF